MSDKFIKTLIKAAKKEVNRIEVSFFAKVISYDKKAMTADILPLLKYEQKPNSTDTISRDSQEIKGVRVDREPGIRPIYVKGDIVHCVIAASPIDEPIENERNSNILKHKFNLSFCTIKGKVKKKTFTAPSQYDSEDGLVLNDDENFYFAFRSDQNYLKGKTVIDGTPLEVNGNSRSLVTHAELNSALQTMLAQLNAAIVTAGGPGTSTLDISASKTDNYKTGPG